MADIDYDIGEAFREIELRLIESMARNLDRHRKWETNEGINWTMWQAEQLKDMRRFAQQNKKAFAQDFQEINRQAMDILAKTAGLDGFEQENRILEALANGEEIGRDMDPGISGSFLGINDRKLAALMESTRKDLERAENAMLRKTADEYRKTIFNAHTYFESGASNLRQAIDMATQDFLEKGISCIQYKNGRMVNIATYSEMALRTANARAGLIADGAKRRETGHHLVKISEYGACSETCKPWQGRVYVDDIYSGGTEEESRKTGFPLLSTAVAGGLFHPNCRHRATTYYPELEGLEQYGYQKGQDPRASETEISREEIEARKQKLLIQREKRLAEGSVDSEKRAEHGAKAGKLEKSHRIIEAPVPNGYTVVEQIFRSIGAKAKNYKVYNPLIDDFTSLVEGTRLIQPKNHVMAGKGRNRKIDVIGWLMEKYKDYDEKNWTKEKGFGYVYDEFGEPRYVELHWYNSPKHGKVEMKIAVDFNGNAYLD